MKEYLSEEEFEKGSKQVTRPSFRGLVLTKLGKKIANASAIHKLVGGDLKKVRQALNNLARDKKIERRLVEGEVYYKATSE